MADEFEKPVRPASASTEVSAGPVSSEAGLGKGLPLAQFLGGCSSSWLLTGGHCSQQSNGPQRLQALTPRPRDDVPLPSAGRGTGCVIHQENET